MTTEDDASEYPWLAAGLSDEERCRLFILSGLPGEDTGEVFGDIFRSELRRIVRSIAVRNMVEMLATVRSEERNDLLGERDRPRDLG